MDLDTIKPVDRLTTKAVAKYVLLPGIFPRLKNLSFIMSKILFTFVVILGSIGLIDRNHPCLLPQNIGRYPFASILLMAWNNVRFDKKHVMQTVMFFSVISSIVILAGIFLAGTAQLMTNVSGHSAQAQYFATPDGGTGIDYKTDKDWAFQFLENIFGGQAKTGIDFWVKEDNIQGSNPWFTSIFVGMLKTYSQALLFIAIFMILYILIMALADAARSGKPFGEKFDPIWAPIRFAVAIGLLLPISGAGYNGAQMLVFQSAEWGSNLATNLWHRGITSQERDKDSSKFIAASISDPGYRFIRDMFLINLCVTTFNQMVTDKNFNDYSEKISKVTIATDGKETLYSFGNSDAPAFCGQVKVPNIEKFTEIPAGYSESAAKQPGGAQGYLPNILAQNFQSAFLQFSPHLGNNEMTTVTRAFAKNFYCERDKTLAKMECNGENCTTQVGKWIYSYWATAYGRHVDDAGKNYFLADYESSLAAYNAWIYDSVKKDAVYGWAAAGAFYLRIAGALSEMEEVVNATPRVTKLPSNFNKIYATPENDDSNEEASRECNMVPEEDKADSEVCEKLAAPYLLSEILQKGASWFAMAPKMKTNKVNNLPVYANLGPAYWDSQMKMSSKEEVAASSWSQLMTPIMSMLYSKLVKLDSTMNPLGQVIGWGNTLVVTAEVAFGISIALSIAAKIWVMASGALTALATIAATIGKVLIAPGFVLMFIVPMLPFMYFTFAVIEWIVSIVEAVIGIPLWALTFITGQGNLGDNAKQGAGMLLEIVLRPTIIVMSLVSSIIVFTASVSFFNNMMEMYISARHGWGIGSLAAIFIYVFSVYALATSCFKIIDAIPNEFGRWIGIGGGFGAIINMTNVARNVTFAGAFVSNELASTASGAANAVAGQAADALVKQQQKGVLNAYNMAASNGAFTPGVGNNGMAPGVNAFNTSAFTAGAALSLRTPQPPPIPPAGNPTNSTISGMPTYTQSSTGANNGGNNDDNNAGADDDGNGPGSPVDPNVPTGAGTGGSTRTTYTTTTTSSGGGTTTYNYNAPNTGGGNNANVTVGGTTMVGASSGFGKKPSGEPYKPEEVSALYRKLGLPESATPGEINKTMQQLRKNGYVTPNDPATKNKSASQIQQEHKQRQTDAENAYEALQRALRMGKFSNT